VHSFLFLRIDTDDRKKHYKSKKTGKKRRQEKQKRVRRTPEQMIELEKTIIELISKFGELTAYKTVIGAQAPKMTVRYMLKRLVVEGKLECEQRGRAKYYSLPNKQYVTGGEGVLQGERGVCGSLGSGTQ